jgi:hypothetical protein
MDWICMDIIVHRQSFAGAKMLNCRNQIAH